MSKFLCSSAALLRLLKQVAPVVRRSPIVPILDNVLLAVAGHTLTLTGSDLETTIVVQLPIENVSKADWLACCPLKPLLEVLANLPDQPITVAAGSQDFQLVLSASVDTQEGEAVGGARYAFAGNVPSDYPKTPAFKNDAATTLPGHLLRTALTYVADLTSSDELRPAMTCVHVLLQADCVRFEATDSHRLVQFDVLAGQEPGYAHTLELQHLLLPAKAVAALRKILKNDDVVQLAVQGQQARFQLGSYGPAVFMRLVDERYPDTDGIMPNEFPGGVLTLSRPAAISMLRRLRPFAADNSNKMALHLKTTGSYAEAGDSTGEGAREPLPGTLVAGGVAAIAFRLDYMLHLLGLLSGPRVRLHLTHSNRAIMLRADGHEGLKYLLMPVNDPNI